MANSLAFWVEDLKSGEESRHELKQELGSDSEDRVDIGQTSPSSAEDSIEENQHSLSNRNPNVELHFNYWLLKAKSTGNFKKDLDIKYLDIGVRLKNINDFSSVNIYVPFEFSNIKYHADLGEKICKDQELVAAVFNAPVIETRSDPLDMTYCDFTFFNESEQIRFHTNILERQSGMSDGVEVTRFANTRGTILKFPQDIFQLDGKADIYFRFRLEISPSEITSISRIYNPKFWALTNAFEKTELVDFRVNEIRNLPKTIGNHIVNKSYVSKIHFFLIRDGKSEFKAAHDSYKRCRILESNLWDKYLGLENHIIDDEMLIYHWKDQANAGKYLDHFSAFAKYTKRDINSIEILVLFIILVVVGALSGWFGNLLWAAWHPSTGRDRERFITNIKS